MHCGVGGGQYKPLDLIAHPGILTLHFLLPSPPHPPLLQDGKSEQIREYLEEEAARREKESTEQGEQGTSKEVQ